MKGKKFLLLFLIIIFVLTSSCSPGNGFSGKVVDCKTVKTLLSSIYTIMEDTKYSDYNFEVQEIIITFNKNKKMYSYADVNLIDQDKKVILCLEIDTDKQIIEKVGRIDTGFLGEYNNTKIDKSKLLNQDLPLDSDEMLNIVMSYIPKQQKSKISSFYVIISNNYDNIDQWDVSANIEDSSYMNAWLDTYGNLLRDLYFNERIELK